MAWGAMLRALVLILASVAVSPARADTHFRLPSDPETARFVSSNLVAVFYHELGHALIDVLMLPVIGSEEDAADTLSALFINRFWPDGEAEALVSDTALGFRLYAERAERGGAETYWDQHALDQEREANLLCLFYGADPAGHGDLVAAHRLPDVRRVSCREEFVRATATWDSMLAGHPPQDSGRGLRLVVDAGRDDYTRLIAAQIDTINARVGLPLWVDVTVERCGEANAFYDLRARRIVMCLEYAEDLRRLYESRGTKP